MKKSVLVAVCGLSTALSVVLMFLCGLAAVLAYTVPMFLGILLICLKKTFGNSSALITYFASSVLSLILVAEKECSLMYIFVFGIYPIVKSSIDKIKIKPLKIILKLLAFNVSLAAAQLILVYLFCVPFLQEGEGKIFILVFVLLMNFVFIIYDNLLEKMLILYEIKLEKRIKKLIK